MKSLASSLASFTALQVTGVHICTLRNAGICKSRISEGEIWPTIDLASRCWSMLNCAIRSHVWKSMITSEELGCFTSAATSYSTSWTHRRGSWGFPKPATGRKVKRGQPASWCLGRLRAYKCQASTLYYL